MFIFVHFDLKPAHKDGEAWQFLATSDLSHIFYDLNLSLPQPDGRRHTRVQAQKFIVCRITDNLSGQVVNNRRRLSDDVDVNVDVVDDDIVYVDVVDDVDVDVVDDVDENDDKRRFKESTEQSFACSAHPTFLSLFISISYLFISLSSFTPRFFTFSVGRWIGAEQ